MNTIPSKLFEISSVDNSMNASVYLDGEFFNVNVTGRGFNANLIYLDLEEAEQAAADFVNIVSYIS